MPFHQRIRRLGRPLLFSFLLAVSATPAFLAGACAAEARLVTTSVKYEVVLDEKLSAVRDQVISGLEARNYAIINQLNVQEGLQARGIQAPPLQLIEFCNLTKAFGITRHVPDFEMFAPCRVALIEEQGKTRVMVLRPEFVLSILAKDPRLSAEGRDALLQFDRDLAAMLGELASGGF